MKIGLVDELGNIDSAIKKAAELARLEAYQLSTYPEKKDQIQEILEMLDTTTPEEKLLLQIREFASEPRIMTLMPEVSIK